jgi:hypothetical protein
VISVGCKIFVLENNEENFCFSVPNAFQRWRTIWRPDGWRSLKKEINFHKKITQKRSLHTLFLLYSSLLKIPRAPSLSKMSSHNTKDIVTWILRGFHL